MTPEEIEEDKQRWFQAHKLLAKTLSERRKWLSQQSEEDQEDMKRRLKIVHERKKRLKNV